MLMKKCIALILSCALILSGCSAPKASISKDNSVQKESEVIVEESKSIEPTEIQKDAEKSADEVTSQLAYADSPDVTFTGLEDQNLLDYVEDNVYLQLLSELNSDEYVVENVEAIYYPKEYIEELAFNSQENIYFGYTASELDAQFLGTRYVFTLGEDGKTTVVPMETFNSDAYVHVLDDVIIGSGVILVCVTVSVLTAGTAPAVSMIFAASAKTATTFALSTSAISAASAAITTGYQTEDIGKTMEQAVVAGAEGFKWGAITGAIAGGGKEAFILHKGTAGGLTMNQVAAIQKESGFPMDLIKQFKSMEEYAVYKDAGLYTKMVDGKMALVRNIDTSFVSELPNGEKVTNLVRMQKGYAPIDPATGKAYQLHHINQSAKGTLAILTEAEHQGNSTILNTIGKESEIDRKAFNAIRKEFWKKYAASLL